VPEREHASKVEAPYITFVTFIRALNRLVEQPPRDRLTREDMPTLGRDAGPLLQSLKVLGFVSSDGNTTLDFHRYAKADPARRRALMAAAIKDRYSWVWDLPAGTPYQDFLTALEARGRVHGDTRRRAASFLVSASRSLGIELPIAFPKKGRPRRDDDHPQTSNQQVATLDLKPNRVDAYLALLSDLARLRLAKTGDIDAAILDRIERLITTYGEQ
jgi:hypothetical protein